MANTLLKMLSQMPNTKAANKGRNSKITPELKNLINKIGFAKPGHLNKLLAEN